MQENQFSIDLNLIVHQTSLDICQYRHCVTFMNGHLFAELHNATSYYVVVLDHLNYIHVHNTVRLSICSLLEFFERKLLGYQ